MRRWRTAALFIALLALPMRGLAVQGDCAQPSSNGNLPTAGDCLFILKAAVGSAACSPACICAPKGVLPTSASDALLCLRRAVGQAVTLACPCPQPSGTGDDFDDNSKDPSKWGTNEIVGNGLLAEVSQRLEYSCDAPTGSDEDIWPWILERLPYDGSWEVQLDVSNLTASTLAGQTNGFGIEIRSPLAASSAIDAQLYMHAGTPYPVHGFRANLTSDGNAPASTDTGALRVSNGAVRMAFDAATKVIRVFYDLEHRDGYQWVEYGSFGLAGSGGADGNTGWGMAPTDTFSVLVSGGSTDMSVAAGKMWGDNFTVIGGVAP